MISIGALPLNVIIAIFHLVTAIGTLIILKKAYRPLTRFTKPVQARIVDKEKKAKEEDEVNYDRVLAMSYIKKYTLLGSFWQGDKKYLLK